MTSLSTFITQLYTGAIDPTTSYFLPTIILEQALPLEPLAIGDHAWGDLTTVSATLPSRLCAAITPGSIGSPGTTATLAFTAMQIVGLSNVVPGQPTVSGPQVSATFSFGGVTSLPPGLTVPPSLQIQGSFAIVLSCCTSNDGTTCAGQPTPQPITGTFAVGFVGAALSLGMTVDPSFAVTVTALSLAASPIKVAFQTQEPLLYAGAINTLLQGAFNTTSVGAAILEAVNSQLGAAATLAALGGVLTPAFQSLSNPPLLAFVVSELYQSATSPKGSFYLPTRISNASNPTLEPYAAGGWDLADVSTWYPAVGGTICGSIGATNNELEIAVPGSTVPLTLTNITIAGTSNLLPAPPLTVEDTIGAIVAFNSVTSWPHTLTISGEFSLGVTCCVTDRQRQACTQPPDAPALGTGTFSASFATATVSGSVGISVADHQLVATVDKLYFRTDPNVDDPQNIQFDIDITSISAGDRAVWNNVAESVFSSSAAVTAIIGQIQQKLDEPDLLQTISTIITTAIQSLLSADPGRAARIKAQLATARRPS
ncbi:MAG TPA: hypothetical protein VFK02_32030 [Kofleriaceae bacterium]|nr:hypothetical protein [Kofleriaceae bacterium]